MMKDITKSLVIVFAVVALVGGATVAFFTDTEKSTGNTVTAGTIDLTVANTTTYNGVAQPTNTWSATNLGAQQFFHFTDVKPGDFGTSVMSLAVNSNDAWVRMNFTKTGNSDASCVEPETEVSAADDPECAGAPVGYAGGSGELDKDLFAILWLDTNKNGIKESSEQLIDASDTLASTAWNFAMKNLWPSPNGGSLDALLANTGANGQFVAGTSYPIAFAWCMGVPSGVPTGMLAGSALSTLASETVNVATCDGSSVGNRAQSDTLTMTISAEATQYRHNVNNPQF